MGNTGVVAAKVSGGGAVAKAKGNLAAVVGVIRRDALGQRLRMIFTFFATQSVGNLNPVLVSRVPFFIALYALGIRTSSSHKVLAI